MSTDDIDVVAASFAHMTKEWKNKLELESRLAELSKKKKKAKRIYINQK